MTTTAEQMDAFSEAYSKLCSGKIGSQEFWNLAQAAAQREAAPAPTDETLGYKLAMRVLQSDLYRNLDDAELGECDALINQGIHAVAAPQLEAALPAPVSVALYECNDCSWKGPHEETVMCGGVGPLCPDCHETTEPIAVNAAPAQQEQAPQPMTEKPRYQVIFDAIADAIEWREHKAVNISVNTLEIALGAKGYSIQPLKSAQPVSEQDKTNQQHFEKLLRALEIIGVGDAKDPQELAGEALVETGYWEKKGSQPVSAPVAIDDLKQQNAELVKDAWISVEDRLPEVKAGDHGTFLVTCRRAHNGNTYVFQACYLNGYLLYDTNEDVPEKAFTGWYDTKDHSDYDEYFEAIDSADGDKVTHWMPMPEPASAHQEGKPAAKGDV